MPRTVSPRIPEGLSAEEGNIWLHGYHTWPLDRRKFIGESMKVPPLSNTAQHALSELAQSLGMSIEFGEYDNGEHDMFVCRPRPQRKGKLTPSAQETLEYIRRELSAKLPDGSTLVSLCVGVSSPPPTMVRDILTISNPRGFSFQMKLLPGERVVYSLHNMRWYP